MGYAEPYLDEGYLESVSCSSASFCMAVGEHAFGGSAEALIFNGSTWSTPSEIPIRPEHVQSYVGSVSCVSASFCAATSRAGGGEAGVYENGAWQPWQDLEMNGELSSVSCPTVSLCVVVSDAGQVFTYSTPLSSPLPGTSNSSPLPSTSTPSGNGLTTPGESTLVNPPTKLHTPLVNDRTGEVTLEYDFPEPGQVEAYGKVIDGVALPSSQASHGAMRRRLVASKARRGQSRKCKTRHVGKRRQCANNAPLYYRQVAFDIRSAGGYKLRIKPSLSVLELLRKHRKLSVRLVLIFTPVGTDDHISETSTVQIYLKPPHRSDFEAMLLRTH